MLELKNITKKYGDLSILNDISLQIEKGEIVSILGPSGSGKTTLLNIILGITDVTDGRILYDGEDITNVPLEKRGFNIVFQDYALFPNLTAYGNIVYGLRNKPDISTKKDVDDLVKLLGLEEHLEKKIDQLSGGQKQRVAIARALINDPDLILADEPTGNLDSRSSEAVIDAFITAKKKLEATTLMVTHDSLSASYCDRVILMRDGIVCSELVNKGNRRVFFNELMEVLRKLNGGE